MNITKYDEKYDNAMEELDQLSFWTVKYHGDLIKESCRLAVEDDELIGMVYLLKRSSFLAIDTNDLAYYELILDYQMNWEKPNATEALELLLAEMKKCCDDISRNYPGKRIFIKTWVSEEEHERIEFFLKQGFVIGRCTPILVRKLDNCTALGDESVRKLQVELEDGVKELEIKALDFDENVMAEYAKSNGSAFVIPDSVTDLWFKLNDPEIKVFAAVCGERIVASVMIWRINEKRGATENIFCIDEFRRKGVTSAVINYACEYLKKEGFEEASLSVYQDNTPAILLYERMGYRYEKLNLGLQYETGYISLAY